MRSRSRLQLIVITSVVVACLLVVLLGVSGLMLRSRILRAIDATRPVAASVNERDIPAACAQLQTAAAAWTNAAAWSRPLAPLLHRLDWVPRLGPELRMAPELVALAHGGSVAGATACDLFEPLLAADEGTNRIATAARQLNDHPTELARIIVGLRQAQVAWTTIAPQIDQSAQLAPYREQLTAVGEQLPAIVQSLTVVEQLAPRLDWLLGIDAPRRYLLTLQNPFELRATGGFIGVVCSLRVDQAQPQIESCRPSETFDVPAPATMEMPAPYSRYLRLGNYYLRDANWPPDFPTTAARLQEFWTLNNQPPVDGVIAADTYMLVPLLKVTGDIELEDGSRLTADEVIETLLARYYDDSVYRDKERVGQLLPLFVSRLMSGDLLQMRATAQALQTAVQERHILVEVNDPAAMAVLHQRGWTGSIDKVAGDVLRVVETDVGYGGVNAFIERLTDYTVDLDDNGTPLSATLTLTFTNRYSPWAESTTSHSVFGNCTDPQTLVLQRKPGCYANYLRVYVPEGSELISSEGLEESFTPEQRYGRTVIGGYLRVAAGEQRTVRLAYSLPEIAPGSLLIEKQPGTERPPVHVTFRHPTGSASAWAWLQTDLRFTYSSDGEGQIDGPGDDTAQQPFINNVVFHRGLQQWQSGDQVTALATWQEGAVLDLALDHARMLANQGATGEALEIAAAVAPVYPGGRGYFEQAALVASQGDAATATQLYQQAAQASPDQPLAQLTWALRVVEEGQPVPDITVAAGASAVRRWRDYTYALEREGNVPKQIAATEVLLRVTPDDRELALKLGDLLFQEGRRDEAFARYQALAQTEDIWGLLAGGRYEQMNGDASVAVDRFVRAIPLAPSESSALRIGDALRSLDRPDEARQSYERAMALSVVAIPESIRPALAAGHVLRTVDPAGARREYEQAAAIDPASGYPDYAIGKMLMDNGDAVGAIPFFEAAMAKEPDVRLYRDTRERAVTLSNSAGAAAPSQ